MKKAIRLVTIPLKKTGYSFGDLCKHVKQSWEGDDTPIGQMYLAVKNYSKENEYWQAQQLLILNDEDDSKVGDIVQYAFGVGRRIEHSGTYGAEVECLICTLEDNIFNVAVGNQARFDELDVNTIIASYPQIEGTLPISKDVVKNWINNDMPNDGHMDYDSDGNIKLTFNN